MSSWLFTGGSQHMPIAVTIDPSYLPTVFGSGMAFDHQNLATDVVGSFALTLTNLVIGSAIRIEVSSTGALIEFRTAASASEVFTVPAYSVGSVLNDLRIRARKGTAAPKYQPFETQATASVGSQSIFIAQVADPIA